MPDKPAPVLIVESRYYEDIATDLAAGAIAALDKAGVPHERMPVQGVFEIPAAIGFALRAMDVRAGHVRYGGFLALGCVIKGETDHYDHICRETSRALMDLAVAKSIALGFGVLTCPTYAHARVRAAPDGQDKGGEAARACLRMMELKRELGLEAR